MSEINPDYTALTNDPSINLELPELRIDIRVILLSLRYELLHQKIYFSPVFYKKYCHVIVPSLRHRFITWYDGGFLYVEIRKRTTKLPCFLDEDMVSERTIDLLCAVIEHKGINSL
jgi:hypothetical protein